LPITPPPPVFSFRGPPWRSQLPRRYTPCFLRKKATPTPPRPPSSPPFFPSEDFPIIFFFGMLVFSWFEQTSFWFFFSHHSNLGLRCRFLFWAESFLPQIDGGIWPFHLSFRSKYFFPDPKFPFFFLSKAFFILFFCCHNRFISGHGLARVFQKFFDYSFSPRTASSPEFPYWEVPFFFLFTFLFWGDCFTDSFSYPFFDPLRARFVFFHFFFSWGAGRGSGLPIDCFFLGPSPSPFTTIFLTLLPLPFFFVSRASKGFACQVFFWCFSFSSPSLKTSLSLSREFHLPRPPTFSPPAPPPFRYLSSPISCFRSSDTSPSLLFFSFSFVQQPHPLLTLPQIGKPAGIPLRPVPLPPPPIFSP